MLNFIDLFAGAGGLSEGFIRAGLIGINADYEVIFSTALQKNKGKHRDCIFEKSEKNSNFVA